MFAKKLGLDSWEITVIGALLMILTNVLKPKEAAQSLPLNILFLIVAPTPSRVPSPTPEPGSLSATT